MLKLKLQYFGHLMRRTDSLEKTLMLEKIEGRGEENGTTEDEMVGWHQWLNGHEFWVNSVSWWWTGRLSVLQSMGLQRVGHDWATELNWLKAEWYSVVCIHHILVFPLSVGGLLGHFYLAVLNNAAVDKSMQIPLWDSAFSSFVYMPRSGVAGLYDSSLFSFLREGLFLKKQTLLLS